MFRLASLVIWLCSQLAFTQPSYENFQLWRLETNGNVGRRQLFVSLIDQLRLDVWSSSSKHVDVLVRPEHLSLLASRLSSKGAEKRVLIQNVGERINTEKEKKMKRASTSPSPTASISLDEYHELDEINAYIFQLEKDNSMITVFNISTSYEGRPINMVRLSTDVTANRDVVWIDCGIHAREWISPASCVYGLDYLTNGYRIIPEITELLDTNDVYVVPVLNVDGYAYTYAEDGDRLWRKNRSPVSSNCFGVDLNRNFDGGNWGGAGSSDSACFLTYHGPSPFSEQETRAVKETLTDLQATSTVKAYFSIHSYGQLWLYVFGYQNTLAPETEELDRVSSDGVAAIFANNGSIYVNGPHYDTIYQASGVSVDWGYSVGILHSYIVELRDEGDNGFILPEDQILPTAEELWTGLLAAISAI